jgi:hypothetical protein
MMKAPPERRARADRRAAAERRQADLAITAERRSGTERRSGGERRGSATPEAQLKTALELLTNVAESGTLDDQGLRDLDAAMFRLRFALDQLAHR